MGKDYLGAAVQPSRRALLTFAGLGTLGVFGAGVLAGCDAGAGTGTAGPTPTGGASPSPSASGGGLAAVQRGAIVGQFDPIDPHVTSNGLTININWYVFEGLYAARVDEPTTYYPALAAGEPEVVDDRSYQVKLREGAVFHDGSPVLASDVVFSFNRIKEMGETNFLNSYLKNFESAEATADDEVVFTLVEPSALFKERVATIKVLPEAAVNGPDSENVLTYSPIGSGPYTVTSADAAVGVELARFEDYAGPLQENLVAESIELKVIPEGVARVSALQAGDVDAIVGVDPELVDTLKADGFEVAEVTARGMAVLFFNAAKAPFDDHRVRQALMYAIDREEMVALDNGGARVANLLVPTDASDYQEPAFVYTRDVDKAKSLLSEAGLPDGFSFELQVPTPGYDTFGQVIQAQAAEAGIQIELRPGDTGALYERVTNGEYQAMIAGSSPGLLGSADAEFVYRWLYYGAFIEQYAWWSGPEKEKVTELLDQAVVAPTREDYLATMKEVYDITTEHGPVIALTHSLNRFAWSPETSAGVSPSSLGMLVLAKGA